MKKTQWLLTNTVVAAAALAWAGAPFAQEIRLLSAGVGAEDRAAHEDYSLKLVFFVKSGPYVANVNVKIFDETGQALLEQVSRGPWMFVDLPPGRYSVIAIRENGEQQGAGFTLDGGGQQQIALAFDES